MDGYLIASDDNKGDIEVKRIVLSRTGHYFKDPENTNNKME